MFSRFLAPLACAVALFAAPAQAVSTITLDSDQAQSFVVNFVGVTDPAGVRTNEGFSGSVAFNFLGAIADKAYAFTYAVDNTSAAPADNSWIIAFGFDVDPNAKFAFDLGPFDEFNIGTPGSNANAFNGLGSVEICFFEANSCNGTSAQGVTVNEAPETGFFTLVFKDPTDTISLDNFTMRWQDKGATRNSFITVSGNGELPGGPPVSAVPEPESWAMLMVGFGLVGAAVRRRRQVTQTLPIVAA